MTEEDKDFERVVKAIDSLGEHFDTVHIFCTRHQADGTVAVNKGTGNWFARKGQIEEWLEKEIEASREAVRKQE